MDKKTLFQYEPVLYQLFENSRKKDRLANAYLLYGNRNAPLKDTACYLSESLGCEKDVFACHECPSCHRFEIGNRSDFALIDGEFKTIRKEEIKALEDKFSMSALEKGHRLTYVIHRIDNITEEASNALLKFLEEPKEGQVAFLTTYNLTKVLPTIVSRCLTVRIDPLDSKALLDEILSHEYPIGKKNIHISMGEAYMLTRFSSTLEEASSYLVNEDKDTSFHQAYLVLESFLSEIPVSLSEASYALLRETATLKDSKCYNWLYLMLNEIFIDCLLDNNEEDYPFREVISALREKKSAVDASQKIIKEAIALKQINLNPTLVLVRMLLALKSEG